MTRPIRWDRGAVYEGQIRSVELITRNKYEISIRFPRLAGRLRGETPGELYYFPQKVIIRANAPPMVGAKVTMSLSAT